MNDLAPVLICAIIFITVYKIFELFVRRNERMAMIEKLSNGIDPRILQKQFTMPSSRNDSYGSWAVRVGFLLMGISLGVAIAITVDLLAVLPAKSEYELRSAISALYPACAAIFGGLGLVVAYFFERKDNKRKDSISE